MANLDWTKLGFGYRKTNTILSCSYKDGQWGPVESHTDDNLTINAFAGALHYSIECFEGLKAFRGADGKVRLFRPEENAKRLQRSANYIGIAAPSVERFIEMCIRVVKENIDFLPPYGTNASMYLRPTLIGINPQLGVKSSTECLFLMLCAPVGAYTGNTLQPSYVVISRDYDKGQSMEKALQTKKPVIVWFYTDWCRYCQKLAPTFKKLTKDRQIKKEYAIAYVNAEDPRNKEYVKEYKVEGYPTVYLVKEGKKEFISPVDLLSPFALDVLKAKFLDFVK